MSKKECINCEWLKSLKDSEGDIHYFCMDVNGGAFGEEAGLLGWCEMEEWENEQSIQQ